MINAYFKIRRILASLFFTAFVPTFLLAQGYPFFIEGKIKSSKNKDKVMLWYPDPKNVSGVKDSALVINGEFQFRGNIKLPGKAILYTIPDYSDIEIFIESGTIKIQSSNSLTDAVVSAGPLNKDFDQLVKMLRPVTQKRSDTFKEYNIAHKALPESADKKVFEDNWDRKKEEIRIERKKVYNEFITKMPNSLVSIEAIKSVANINSDFKELTDLFESLTTSVRSSPSGKEYKRELTRLSTTSIGAAAPNFTQTDTAGNLVSLNDFRGKYVFIDFWASWCAPCRAEHPGLVKVFKAFNSRNFTIIGISLDQLKTKEAWLKAIHKDGLLWTQLSDLKGWANAASSLYNVEFIPKNYLIGPDGIILAKDLTTEALNSKLDQVLVK